ncbi:MAG: hypothetical protein OQK71_08730 [Desulfobacter sp.]|nr:hypothetical protein [Desulfobacter sp.]
MSHAPPTSARIREEHLLINHCRDFSAAYMGIKYIGRQAVDYPFSTTRQTLDALFSVFETTRFKGQTSLFFIS